MITLLIWLYLNVHEMSDNFSDQQQILTRLRPFNAAVITHMTMKRVSLFLFLCFKCFIVCLALLLFLDRNKLLEGFWHVLIMHLKIILFSIVFFCSNLSWRLTKMIQIGSRSLNWIKRVLKTLKKILGFLNGRGEGLREVWGFL